MKQVVQGSIMIDYMKERTKTRLELEAADDRRVLAPNRRQCAGVSATKPAKTWNSAHFPTN